MKTKDKLAFIAIFAIIITYIIPLNILIDVIIVALVFSIAAFALLALLFDIDEDAS